MVRWGGVSSKNMIGAEVRKMSIKLNYKKRRSTLAVLRSSLSPCTAVTYRHLFLLTLLILLCSVPARGQEVLDKMVATVTSDVETDLITYSDLRWQLALQPDTPLVNPSSEALNQALRLVEDQRLILQEAKKLPAIAPTAAEIQAELNDLVKRFPSPAEFQQRVARVGLTSEKLNDIVADRVRTEKYLDFRFRNFTVITQQEVADYYRATWVAQFKTRNPGRIVPTLEGARGEIERILTERKVESDIDNFLDGARERAEIVILNPV